MSKILQVRRLEAAYGDSQVLFGVSFDIECTEVVTLLGRNGMGKTTTISAVMGVIPPCSGEVIFGGKRINGWPSFRIARCGIGLVPEGRQIFPNLTVRENLIAMAANWGGQSCSWTLETTLDLFPALRERIESPGSVLSGGEQQMLAIGRALMINPQLLILDEATEGLAPLVREEIWNVLVRLKAAGLSILVVDKNIKALNRIVDRHYVLEKGRVVWSGGPKELLANPELQNRYLGV